MEEAAWIQVQKKTFTKWVNQQLAPVGVNITDIYQDFRNGINLVTLLQVLFKEPIVACGAFRRGNGVGASTRTRNSPSKRVRT